MNIDLLWTSECGCGNLTLSFDACVRCLPLDIITHLCR